MSDTRINQITARNQQFPYITLLADGRSLVTWSSRVNTTDYSHNIMGRFLDASGNPLGSDFIIEAAGSDGGYSVAKPLPNGNILISWNGFNNEIYAKIISSSGTTIVNNFPVNSTIAGYQSHSSIAMIDSNKLIITWQSINTAYTAATMYGQFFDLSGNKIGGEMVLNNLSSVDYINDVTSLNNGDFILARSNYSSAFNRYDSYTQLYDASGAKKGAETLITNSQNASIVQLANGNFIAIWTAMNGASATGIHGQIFNSNNQAVGNEYVLSGLEKASSFNVVLLKYDYIAIAWDQYNAGTSSDSYVQIFSPNGTPVTQVYQLNEFTPSNQNLPKITQTPDGNIIAIWQSDTQDGDAGGIYSRVITTNLPHLEVSNTNPANSYTEDTQMGINSLNISSNNPNITVDITLSDVSSGTIISENSANVTSSYNASTGTWHVSGDKNAVNILLSGLKFIPAANYNNNVHISYRVTDGQNLDVTGNINLTAIAVNDAPTASTIDNLQIHSGEAINASFANKFSDVDGDALTYSLKMANGLDAPNWLSINPTTLVLAGIAPIGFTGLLHLSLIADDNHGGTVNSNFDIDVTAPVIPLTLSGIDPIIYANKAAISLASSNQNLNQIPVIESPDGQTVYPDAISPQRLTLTESGNVILTFKNSVAGYGNSLGWYVIAADGTITNPQLLIKNAHEVTSGTQYNLGTLTAGSQIGFFIAANGASGVWLKTSGTGDNIINMNQLDLVNGSLKFIGSNNSDASVYDNFASTLVYVLNGAEYRLNQNTYHSSGNAKLNADGQIHSGAGWDSGKNDLLIGFEDLYGGGDKDYNDILFHVDLGSNNEAVKYAGSPQIAPNITITGTDTNITQAQISIASGYKTGDMLVFEGHNLVNGVISGTNITAVTSIAGGILTLKLEGLAGNAEYEGLIHSIKLINIGNSDNSGMRDIAISVTDSGGHNASSNNQINITNNPVNGTNAADNLVGTNGNDNLHGHGGNDVIHGGFGADLLTGGAGSDSFDFSFLTDSKNGAFDTITDFEHGIDHINLHNLASNFADLTITQNATETIITANQSQAEHFELHLDGHIDLHQDDFLWG